jgi:phosphate starvation-inducible protein PhoH
LLEQWANNLNDVLLIVDEAHHATAKTYRKVINALKKNSQTNNVTTLECLG